MKVLFQYLTFLLLITLTACGGGDSENSDEFERQEEEVPEPETLQRNYRGDIRPINPEDNIRGQVLIRLVEDRFETNIAIQNVPNSRHPQYVMRSKNCPGMSADLNGDGVVSSEEAIAVTGEIFIPLDSDLDSNGDNGEYPTSDFINAYIYDESTNRNDLLAQLGEEYRLDDRVFLIYGRGDDSSLPIACATLSQITGLE